jgi:MFS transporter, DHA1 family, solute carrier family 18 (vesicular amine transporter), member 1/2
MEGRYGERVSAPALHPDRTRVFALATTAIAVDTLMFSAIIPALPGYQREMGLSDTAVALIFAAFPITQLVVGLLASKWVDRAGRRRAMMTGAVLLAAAGLGFAFATEPLTLTLARAVLGGAAALTWMGALAAVADVYPPNQLGFRMGLAETAGGGAGLMGPLLSGALITWIGIRATFAILAAVPLVVLIGAALVPETARPSASRPSLARALRGLARSPGARAGGLALILLGLVQAMLEPLLPLNLSSRLGLGPMAIGAVLAVGMAALFLGAPVGGRWSDRVGRRTPIIVGGAITVVGLPLVTVGPAWWVAVAFALTLLGAAVMAAPAGPLFTEAVDDMGHAGSYGLAAGAIVVVFAAGFALGPLVGGGLTAIMPFTGVAIAGAALVAAGTVAMAIILPRRPRDSGTASRRATGPGFGADATGPPGSPLA